MKVQNTQIPGRSFLHTLGLRDVQALTLEHSWERARRAVWPEPREPEGKSGYLEGWVRFTGPHVQV